MKRQIRTAKCDMVGSSIGVEKYKKSRINGAAAGGGGSQWARCDLLALGEAARNTGAPSIDSLCLSETTIRSIIKCGIVQNPGNLD